MHRRYKHCILLLLIIVLLAGCGDQMEVDKVTFPIVMGIDWDDAKQLIQVYAQVSTISSQSGGSAQTEKKYKVIRGEGKTLLKAMIDTTDHAQQSISWKHIIAVVLTEKTAKHGISGILDHLSRFGEMHINSYLLITKDNLEDLLGSTPKIESGLPSPIVSISAISQQNTHSKVVTIKDYVYNYLSREAEPVLPMISIFKLEEKQQNKEIEFDYKGLGVFKEDKLVGWLDENETRGFTFVSGTQNKGSLVLKEFGETSETEMTIHSLSIKPKVTPKLQQNKPSISIKLQAEYDLGESNSALIINIKAVSELNAQVEAYIKKEVEAVIKKAQKELKADIFGFGGSFYRKYTEYWQQKKGNWDDVFSKIDVKVDVEAQLKDTDELSNSLKSILEKDEKSGKD